MGQKSGPVKEPVEQVVKEIRRATRRQFSAEEKIRIVLSGLRGEDSIAELCRREGIVQNLYYRWSKEFLEAGKKRLAGDTVRAATSDEVKELRREATALKEVVAELTLENRVLKKSTIGDGGDDAGGIRLPRSSRSSDRTIASGRPADAGQDRHSPSHILSLVRSLSVRWPRGPQRPVPGTGSGVEPYSRGGPAETRGPGARGARSVAPRVGGALHRNAEVLFVG